MVRSGETSRNFAEQHRDQIELIVNLAEIISVVRQPGMSAQLSPEGGISFFPGRQLQDYDMTHPDEPFIPDAVDRTERELIHFKKMHGMRYVDARLDEAGLCGVPLDDPRAEAVREVSGKAVDDALAMIHTISTSYCYLSDGSLVTLTLCRAIDTDQNVTGKSTNVSISEANYTRELVVDETRVGQKSILAVSQRGVPTWDNEWMAVRNFFDARGDTMSREILISMIDDFYENPTAVEPKVTDILSRYEDIGDQQAILGFVEMLHQRIERTIESGEMERFMPELSLPEPDELDQFAVMLASLM